MDMNLVVLLGGICGGLLIVVLLVAFAQMFATRRRVTALTKQSDVAGLKVVATTSTSSLERSVAIDALGRLGTEEAVEALTEALKGEQAPAMRQVILEGITASGADAVGPLLRSWKQMVPEERAGATVALLRLGQKPLSEALAGVAREDPEAIGSLWRESDAALRSLALEAMISLKEGAVAPLLGVWSRLDSGERERAEDALVAIGPSVVEPLTRALGAEPQQAEAAARVLSRISEPGGVGLATEPLAGDGDQTCGQDAKEAGRDM